MATTTPAPSTTQTIAIDGMKGDACVQKVKTVLKDVHGLKTDSVTVGSAKIEGDAHACKAACGAINNASFKATMPVTAASPDEAVVASGAAHDSKKHTSK